MKILFSNSLSEKLIIKAVNQLNNYYGINVLKKFLDIYNL
jgi:hypothetical protein